MNLFYVLDLYADPIVKLLNSDWLANITVGSIIVRLLIAIICGGILGAERAVKRHAAGFRTYILVAVGAAIAGLANQFIIDFFGSGDGARLGAQVISGIGFLCAGTILVTSRSQIKGLTTAAGLWACGVMGLAAGLGFYTLALISCVIIFLILSILPPIEDYFIERSRAFTLHVELESRPNLKELVNYLRNEGYQVTNVEHNVAYASSGLSVYTLSVSEPFSKEKKTIKTHKEVAAKIEELPYVNHAEILQ